MREYAKLAPKFFAGEICRALRRIDPSGKGLLVWLYLQSSPHSNMLGLYYQPIPFMGFELGIGEQEALKGLQACIDLKLCTYDSETFVVWVFDMAAEQIAPELKATDLRCKGIQGDYDNLPDNPFLGPWFDRYAQAFNLTRRREGTREFALFSEAPYQAPSKPGAGAGAGAGVLPSAIATGLRGGANAPPSSSPSPPDASAAAPPAAPPAPRRKRVKPPSAPPPGSEVFDAYAASYRSRYGTDPVRNAKVNAQLVQLVARLGSDEAPKVASFFVGHDGPRYQAAMHPVDLLLLDAEKLRTEWATGRSAPTPPPRFAASAAERNVATLNGLTGRSRTHAPDDPRPEPPLADIVDIVARRL